MNKRNTINHLNKNKPKPPSIVKNSRNNVTNKNNTTTKSSIVNRLFDRKIVKRIGTLYLQEEFKQKSDNSILGMKSWKEKYLVFQGINIYIYDHIKHAQNNFEPNKIINLNNITGLVNYGNTKSCRLDITLTANKKIQLRGINRNIVKQWYDHIKSKLNKNVYTLSYD